MIAITCAGATASGKGSIQARRNGTTALHASKWRIRSTRKQYRLAAALMMAALFARTNQIAMLRAAGADAGIEDASGRTASLVAAAQGSTEIAKDLAGKQ